MNIGELELNNNRNRNGIGKERNAQTSVDCTVMVSRDLHYVKGLSSSPLLAAQFTLDYMHINLREKFVYFDAVGCQLLCVHRLQGKRTLLPEPISAYQTSVLLVI